MKLQEYLRFRGGNNITNAEAHAIGIIIEKGWPEKYKNAEVPEHLSAAIVNNKNMLWPHRRKNLKQVANLEYIEKNDSTFEDAAKKLEMVKNTLQQALRTFENNPYQAFSEVSDALEMLESIR